MQKFCKTIWQIPPPGNDEGDKRKARMFDLKNLQFIELDGERWRKSFYMVRAQIWQWDGDDTNSVI